MILDTSAIIAVLFGEPDAEVYAAAIGTADPCRISAATFVEVGIVVDSQTKGHGSRSLDALLRRANVTIEPVTAEQAHLAREAYAEFGKGRHRAGLNYGDCFAYALAKVMDEPLLYKGSDFKKTDILSAL
jgi:ribonuclease VapC